MPKPSRLVGSLLFRNGRMLLGKRSARKRTWPKTWDMPGGHVEKGESFEDALLRETEEEIGVVPERFSLWADMKTDEGEPYRIFLVERWSGGEPALCNHEHTELRWFTPADAARLEPLADQRYAALFKRLIGF